MTEITREKFASIRNHPGMMKALDSIGTSPEHHVFLCLAGNPFRTDEEENDMQELYLFLQPSTTKEALDQKIVPRLHRKREWE